MIAVSLSPALARHRLRFSEAAPALVIVAGYFLFPNYLVFGASIMVMALFALSLDLIIGFAGILTLGHGVFYGIGAYGSGLLDLHGVKEPVLNALAGFALAALGGLAVGPFVLRLRGLRLVMVTLGIAAILMEAANKANGVTGGHDGLQGLDYSPIFGRFEWSLDGSTSYVFVACWLMAALVILRMLTTSSFGMALVGIRENEGRMLALGAGVRSQLSLAFAISAGFAGLAGALSAQTNAFVSLDALGLDLSIYALAMLVLGGIGRLYGALLGATVYMCVQYFTQELNPSYWMFAIGFLLIFVVRFGRGGLLGMIDVLKARLAGAAGAR